jgi:hypothetical protein
MQKKELAKRKIRKVIEHQMRLNESATSEDTKIKITQSWLARQLGESMTHSIRLHMPLWQSELDDHHERCGITQHHNLANHMQTRHRPEQAKLFVEPLNKAKINELFRLIMLGVDIFYSKISSINGLRVTALRVYRNGKCKKLEIDLEKPQIGKAPITQTIQAGKSADYAYPVDISYSPILEIKLTWQQDRYY